jgi:general stress protein 26
MASADDRKKVWDLIQDIRIAMMATKEADGSLSSRPMSAANTSFDGTLWFFAREGSAKTEDIARERDVLLAYSHPSKQHYVSLAGKARLSHDRAKIKELWSEMARVWFPDGPDDPSIVLIEVDVDSAQYWDSPGSAVVLLYGYVKARLTGKPPEELGENRKVAF